MGIQSVGSSAVTGFYTAASRTKPKQTAVSQADDGIQAFKNYMKETPAARIEDAWLKAHNLTRQQLEDMTPEQQNAVKKQMATDIENQLKQKTGATLATKIDILV